MSDYQLQEPELHVPEREEPLATPPLHWAAPAPLDVPLPELPFMEHDAVSRAYRTLPEALPPDPQPYATAPTATWGLKYQAGITDEPALSLGLLHRLGPRSDLSVGAQLSLSSQSDNPNDTDKTNWLQGGGPLGDVDFTPGAPQIPSDGQSPPLSAADVRDALSRHPQLPENVPMPIQIHPPADTICRGRR